MTGVFAGSQKGVIYDAVKDIFVSNDHVLLNAFNKKYGSSTKDINRNKGLPAIKMNSDSRLLQELILVTNDVILDFDNPQNNSTFTGEKSKFKGTIYQWKIKSPII